MDRASAELRATLADLERLGAAAADIEAVRQIERRQREAERGWGNTPLDLDEASWAELEAAEALCDRVRAVASEIEFGLLCSAISELEECEPEDESRLRRELREARQITERRFPARPREGEPRHREHERRMRHMREAWAPGTVRTPGSRRIRAPVARRWRAPRTCEGRRHRPRASRARATRAPPGGDEPSEPEPGEPGRYHHHRYHLAFRRARGRQ
jgi:hypothetical protein